MATYMGRPKNPRQTAKAGYISNPENIEYDEHISMSRGLKDKFMSNHVILDLTEQKIVKNSFNSNRNFEEVFAHFMQNYEQHIKDSIQKLTGVNINTDLEGAPIASTVAETTEPSITGVKSEGLSST
jgi:hypothetical protein